MKFRLAILFFFTLTVLRFAPVSLQASEANDFRRIQASTLLYIGQGKGTLVGWDVGVMKAIEEKAPHLLKYPTLTGDSGAAITATHFACHGITKQTISEAESMLKRFDPTLVNENTPRKLLKVAWVLAGISRHPVTSPLPTRDIKSQITQLCSLKHDNLKPVIDEITRDCQFLYPLGMVASNEEVLDNLQSAATFNSKHVDPNTMTVTDGDGNILGKACTYFATQPLFDFYMRIPWQKRRCDVKLIKDIPSLKFALNATVSEPTFYPPIKDNEPGLVAGFRYPNATYENLHFSGGFAAPGGMADDFIEANEVIRDIPILGTGRAKFSTIEGAVIKVAYLLELNPLLEATQKAIAHQKKGIQIEISSDLSNELTQWVPPAQLSQKIENQVRAGYLSTVSSLTFFLSKN